MGSNQFRFWIGKHFFDNLLYEDNINKTKLNSASDKRTMTFFNSLLFHSWMWTRSRQHTKITKSSEWKKKNDKHFQERNETQLYLSFIIIAICWLIIRQVFYFAQFNLLTMSSSNLVSFWKIHKEISFFFISFECKLPIKIEYNVLFFV